MKPSADAAPGAGPPGGGSMETGPGSAAAQKKPIRIVLSQLTGVIPGDAKADGAREPISPLVGLGLGLVALLGMLCCTQATVVLFLFGCALVLLHRDLAVPATPLEDYVRVVPAWLERLFHKLRNPDGKVILAILLLAVAIFLAPQIVFGMAGAAALGAALYLLGLFDRPAEDLMRWLTTREPAWAAWGRARLGPARALALAVLSCGPPLFCLAGAFLPHRLTPAFSYRLGLAGGLVCLLMALAFLGRVPRVGRAAKPHQSVGGRTLFCATLALSLALLCVGVQIARRVKIPLLTEVPEWNGVWLGFFPLIGLWIWWSRYCARWREGPDNPAASDGSANEVETWRYSALGGAVAAGVGALLWRATEVEKNAWADAGGVALSAVAVLGWWSLSKILLGLGRARPGARIPEWTMVFLAATACMVGCSFLVQFGGAPGLVAGIYPMVLVWKEAARLLRHYHLAGSTTSTAPAAPDSAGPAPPAASDR